LHHLYTATYREALTSSSLQCEVEYKDTGGTAQVAAAHCPNEWTMGSSSSTKAQAIRQRLASNGKTLLTGAASYIQTR